MQTLNSNVYLERKTTKYLIKKTETSWSLVCSFWKQFKKFQASILDYRFYTYKKQICFYIVCKNPHYKQFAFYMNTEKISLNYMK